MDWIESFSAFIGARDWEQWTKTELWSGHRIQSEMGEERQKDIDPKRNYEVH